MMNFEIKVEEKRIYCDCLPQELAKN